jgi:hypothetical protein
VSRNAANGGLCALGADWKYGTSEHLLGKSGRARSARAELGFNFVWIKIGLRGFTPMQLAFGRVLLAAAVLPMSWLRGLQMLNATTPLGTATVTLPVCSSASPVRS